MTNKNKNNILTVYVLYNKILFIFNNYLFGNYNHSICLNESNNEGVGLLSSKIHILHLMILKCYIYQIMICYVILMNG